MLCENGANLDARSSNKGKTPLEIARDKGKLNVVAVLQDFIRNKGRNNAWQRPETGRNLAKTRGLQVYPQNRFLFVCLFAKDASLQMQKHQPINAAPTPVRFQRSPSLQEQEQAQSIIANSRRGSDMALQSEKLALMKQLRKVERQEAVHELNREGRKIDQQLGRSTFVIMQVNPERISLQEW